MRQPRFHALGMVLSLVRVAMHQVNWVAVHLNRGYPVLDHIGRVGADHRIFPASALMQQDFLAIGTPATLTAARAAVDVSVLLPPVVILRPHAESPAFALRAVGFRYGRQKTPG